MKRSNHEAEAIIPSLDYGKKETEKVTVYFQKKVKGRNGHVFRSRDSRERCLATGQRSSAPVSPLLCLPAFLSAHTGRVILHHPIEAVAQCKQICANSKAFNVRRRWRVLSGIIDDASVV